MSGSAGGSGVIGEFLVKIGYSEQGREQVGRSLSAITAQAGVLALAFKGAAGTIQDAIGTIASGLEQLGFTAQRTQATVESIKAIGFAASQVGSSVEAARGSLENLGRFIWSNPSAENFIQSLGVQTRDANGKLIETGTIFKDLVRRIRTEQPAVQQAYAQLFGIDENLLRANFGEFEKEEARYRKMLAAAHIDGKRAAEDAHFLGSAWRGLGGAVGILGTKIEAAFSRPMGELVTRFTTWLTNNFDKIVAVLQWVTDSVDRFGTVFGEFGRGLWKIANDVKKSWDKMDDDSKSIIKTLGFIGVAVLALDAIMKMSLIGRIALLALAIGALAVDYRQWKEEGKQSPIDWAKWDQPIQHVKEGLGRIWDAAKGFRAALVGKDGLLDSLGAFGAKLRSLGDDDNEWVERPIRGALRLIHALTRITKALAALARGDLTGAFDALVEGEPTSTTELSPNEVGGTGKYGAGQEGLGANLPEMLRKPGGVGEAFMRWRNYSLPTWLGGGTADRVPHPGAGAALSDPEREANRRESYLFWKEKGFNDAGAAAMVAAEGRESTFNPASRGDPNKQTGVPEAHGLFQWHFARRQAMQSDPRVNINVSTATHRQQLEAAEAEMRLGLDPQAGAAYQSIKNAADERTAAWYVVNGMLRPADRAGAVAVDTGAATDIMRRYRGQTLTPQPPVPAQPPVPLTPEARENILRDFEESRRRRALTPDIPRLTPTVDPSSAGPIVSPQSSISNDNSRSVELHQDAAINVTVNGQADGWAIGRSVLEAHRTAGQQLIRDTAAHVG